MVAKNKKRPNREREKRNRQWQSENQTLLDFRRKAPQIKAHLRKRGLNFPFYDYLDSYRDEFLRIADFAKTTYPTLLEVHEVNPEVFDSLEDNWTVLGYGNLRQIFFNIDDEVADYGRKNLDANLNGATIVFHDAEDRVRTVIVMNKAAKCTLQHADLKYALKIAGLCHEIGHVHDVEHGTNFDVSTRTLNVIEAEVFAHSFGLELMAKRNLQQSYQMLFDALHEAANKDGYLGKVAAAVVEKVPKHTFVDWQSYLD